MMHKAWCSLEEVPYSYSRSSIKFQGQMGWKIENLNPIWARLLGQSQLSNPLDLPCLYIFLYHYNDVIMGAIASQITSVYSTVYSYADQRKHKSSASLAICEGNSLGTSEFPAQCPVTRKMFPFDDVIMFFHSFQVAMITQIISNSTISK